VPDREDHPGALVVPMGNYVSEVGNYVSVSPSELGNYVSADTLRQVTVMTAVPCGRAGVGSLP